jgi:hypothetical protein
MSAFGGKRAVSTAHREYTPTALARQLKDAGSRRG